MVEHVLKLLQCVSKRWKPDSLEGTGLL